MNKSAVEHSAAKESSRKKYMPPELVVYGSLVELTRSAGNFGNIDPAFVGSRDHA
jgi:hypothetical protein